MLFERYYMRTPIQVIREMTGKINTQQFLSTLQSGFLRLFGDKDLGVDYARNDYDLFRAIYHASRINNKGREYLLAAALGKPIINITTGFVVGKGFNIEIDNPTKDERIAEAEDRINSWLEENMADLYDVIKFHFRDGDGYLYIDDFGQLDLLDAKTVTVQLDPVSSQVIGYDVRETADELNPNSGQKITYIYLRQYRLDSVRILRWAESDSQENATIVFRQEFRREAGNQFSELVQRRLPIVHFANEKEARQVYGNSEYQNLLTIFKNYHAVLANSTKGVIYNGTPIPVLKGVSDPAKLAVNTKDPDDTSEDSGKKLEWNQDTVLYLTGDGADAKFLQVSGLMDDAAKLLEIYFFLFVQGSETPEFAFGAAVSSSKASTETQMPVLVKKVERKQRRLTGAIQELVQLYIERNALLSDPLFINLSRQAPKIRVNFPNVAEEDKQLTLEAVQWAVENSIMTAETALRLVAGDMVKDVKEEIKNAAAEATELKRQNAEFDTGRMLNELLLKQRAGTDNPTE